MKLGEELKKYSEGKTARFHMPGHKGISSCLEKVFLLENDVTEIEGLDNLHNPNGVIKDLLDNISTIYGSDKSFISTNGSTTSLQSAILGVTIPGDSILVSRNCHKSVYNAMILGDLHPVYLMPEYDVESGLSWIKDLDILEEILKENEKIKAVVLTYPTYFGVCCDMEGIAEIVHKYKRILIVDEAHGSHLRFCNNLPKSALDTGGDIVIQSTHKTLPSLTQSSLLHVNNEKYAHRIEDMVSMLLTSSPSYLMMASIEASVDMMKNEGNDRLEKNISYAEEMSLKYENAGKIFKDRKYFLDRGVFDFDNTRLLFKSSDIGISGGRAESILRNEYNVQVEMSDLNYINAFMTVCDEKEDIEKLFKSVDCLVVKYGKETISQKKKIISKHIILECPQSYVNIRKAFYSDKAFMEIGKTAGEICGNYIIPYPPGIPLLCPGEKITEGMVDNILEMCESGIEVMGLDNGKIEIILV